MFNQLSNFHIIDNFVYDINLVPDMFIPLKWHFKTLSRLFQFDLMMN